MTSQILPSIHDEISQPTGIVSLLSTHSTELHWAIVRVSGDDAETFLQGQLSNDIAALDQAQSCLAAWCDAKGRMLASMLVLREPNNPSAFLLLCHHNLLSLILQRLKMFVLRSKVVLEDASAAYCLYGALGATAQNVWNSISDDVAMQDWHYIQHNTNNQASTYIALPSARLLWLQPSINPQDPFKEHNKLDIEAWTWAEIASGIIMLEQAISAKYIPQMLNYESAGGINFRKGCYPGQEVVARTQFRGKIKRRGYIATVSISANVCVDDAIWCATNDAPDDGFTCGTVVQTAKYNDAVAIFVVLQTSVVEQYQNQQATLYLESGLEHTLTLYALPYILKTAM